MTELIQKEMESLGCRSRVVPIARIAELKEDIARFAEAEELNGFQKWIVTGLYRYEEPDIGFAPLSAVIAAAPSPAYANVEFTHGGRTISVKCLHPARIFDRAAPDALLSILKKLLEPKGYHIAPAPSLPFKRLAAASGLARYGRNNITYVEGLGSFFNYAAFFTDVACETDNWQEVRMAERCGNCRACMEACPTGAIRRERFLIDNERCLSCYNEGPGEFPAWIPAGAHHSVYDCLRCQLICPMNREFIQNMAGPIVFSEQETGLLLAGAKFAEFPPDMQRKVERLGIDKWPDAIPRNMKVLFQQSENKA